MDNKENRKLLDKLEDNLGHFLISELCKADPSRRSSPEMYKYKGLSINVDLKQQAIEKTVSIRIGVLEAEYKIDSCEKNSGCLAPEEERLISMWLSKSENNYRLKTIFKKKTGTNTLSIIPFDLEHFYE